MYGLQENYYPNVPVAQYRQLTSETGVLNCTFPDMREAGGQTVLHLFLWDKWRMFVNHRKYDGLFFFRGFYFDMQGHAIKRERVDDSDTHSEDFSPGEEPGPYLGNFWVSSKL